MIYDIDDSLTDEILLGSGVARTRDRVHLTDIVRYIMKVTGKAKNSGVFQFPGLAMEVGFLWEDVISAALGSRMAARLGEVVVDGIAMSPDGFSHDEVLARPVVEEYKCTWRSSKRDPTDNWDWMAQVKSYCHGLGVTDTVFRILYLVGDWKGGGPVYRVCRVQFTEGEIRDNWEMVLANRDDAWADKQAQTS